MVMYSIKWAGGVVVKVSTIHCENEHGIVMALVTGNS